MGVNRLILLLLVPFTAAKLCHPGHEFWDASSDSCVSCKRCKGSEPVVLRPCQVHRDTICGPISSLNIDWSWLDKNGHNNQQKKHYHHNHHHEHHKNEKEQEFNKEHSQNISHNNSGSISVSFIDDFSQASTDQVKNHHDKLMNKHHHQTNRRHHQQHESGIIDESSPNVHLKDRFHWTAGQAAKLLSHDLEIPRQHHSKHKNHQKHVFSSDDISESLNIIDHKKNADSSENRHNNHHQGHHHNNHHHHHHKNLTKDSSIYHKHNDTRTHHGHHTHRHSLVPESASLLKTEFDDSVVLPKINNPDSEITAKPKTHLQDEKELRFMFLQSEDMPKSVKGNTDWNIPEPIEDAPAIGSAEPFSAAETLVWDGQAIALTLAVFACILFFLVAAIYSIHHARQWRRLKNNFEADVEELSARLSLMTSGSGNDQPDNSTPTDMYNAKQCVFLEQLLVRKQNEKAGEGNGNVYIEREPPSTQDCLKK